MQKSKIVLVLAAIFATACVVSFANRGAIAASKLQAKGTFTCTCSVGTGTCTLITTPDSLYCSVGTTATCKGTCQLTTTTTGIGGAAAIRGAGKINTQDAVKPAQ